MNGLRTGETVQDGRAVPEAEVSRGDGAAAPFQVREAVTVRLGPRGGRMRMAGETPAPTGQTFQVRGAVTVELPPPHWAALTEPKNQQEETNHASQPGPDANRGQD